jgi:hypothetical protein
MKTWGLQAGLTVIFDLPFLSYSTGTTDKSDNTGTGTGPPIGGETVAQTWQIAIKSPP